jgi:hypothetical protein
MSTRKERRYKHVTTVPFVIGETKDLTDKQKRALYRKIQAFINKQDGVKCLNHDIFQTENKDGVYADIISNEFSFTKEELDQLRQICEKIADDKLQHSGLYKLSSGFAKATITEFDKESIRIVLSYGIYDSDGEDFATENYEIERSTMQILE